MINKYGFIFAALGLSTIALLPGVAAAADGKKHTVWKDQVEKTESWRSMSWRPVITLSGGAAFSDRAGTSQFIPIFDPEENEFFDYSASNSDQAKFLFGASLGMEILLNPSWLLQTGFSYYQPTEFHARGTVVQGADLSSVDTFAYRYDMQPRQVLFENKLLYRWMYQSMSFLPYISAGIGVGINSAENYRVNILPPFTTFSNQFQDETNTAFSYRVGLGIDYEVNSWVRVGLGYRFADFGKISLGNAVIDDVPTFNSLGQSHFYTNELLGQVTFVM